VFTIHLLSEIIAIQSLSAIIFRKHIASQVTKILRNSWKFSILKAILRDNEKVKSPQGFPTIN
jgi:hypothetical protein